MNNNANPSLAKLYKVQTLLKVAFLFCSLLYQTYAPLVAAVVCILAVYRRHSPIQFNLPYLSTVLRNEYGSNLLFILSFFTLPNKSIFFYAPLAVHFVTGINEYLSMFHSNSPYILKYAPNLILSLKNMKKYLMVFKAKVEFVYFLVSVVLTLFNFSRLVGLLVYGQFMLVKMRMSQDFNDGIGEVDGMLGNLLGKVGLGGVYGKVREVCGSIKRRLVQ